MLKLSLLTKWRPPAQECIDDEKGRCSSGGGAARWRCQCCSRCRRSTANNPDCSAARDGGHCGCCADGCDGLAVGAALPSCTYSPCPTKMLEAFANLAFIRQRKRLPRSGTQRRVLVVGTELMRGAVNPGDECHDAGDGGDGGCVHCVHVSAHGAACPRSRPDSCRAAGSTPQPPHTNPQVQPQIPTRIDPASSFPSAAPDSSAALCHHPTRASPAAHKRASIVCS